jgi:hypothetical protein
VTERLIVNACAAIRIVVAERGSTMWQRVRRAVWPAHPAGGCLGREAAAMRGVPPVTADARLRRLAPAGLAVVGPDDLS